MGLLTMPITISSSSSSSMLTTISEHNPSRGSCSSSSRVPYAASLKPRGLIFSRTPNSGMRKTWLRSRELSNQLLLPTSTQLCHSQKWRSDSQPEIEDPSTPSNPSSKSPLPFDNLLHLSSENLEAESTSAGLVGEDAAVFDVNSQKISSWLLFTAILGVVLAILYIFWIDPETGYGGPFIDAISSLNSNHEVVMLIILFIFALVHSGLASLRGAGEKLVGERAYRVFYAASSLPLAVSAVVYFMNHRYDGVQLWDVRTFPGLHELVWAMSFISFLFLYPSTFNLLEVAAVDKPKVHMWETGIMRITRHPQMVGQFLWCFAHTLWIGNSFTVTTSIGLVAHHLFGVWHGDKRLTEKHGEAYEVVKQRTSIVPFAAILDGRQKLPEHYYKEFLRLPYFVIVGITLGAYWSQALLQSASQYLNCKSRRRPVWSLHPRTTTDRYHPVVFEARLQVMPPLSAMPHSKLELCLQQLGELATKRSYAHSTDASSTEMMGAISLCYDIVEEEE